MRVFVSYSRRDEALAHLFCGVLQRARINYDVDQRIEPGTRFHDEIRLRIRRADVLLLLLTRNSIASPWVNQEVGYALAHSKRILPISMERKLEPEGMINLIESYMLLDWSSPVNSIDRLARHLKRIVDGADPYDAARTDGVFNGRTQRALFLADEFERLAERARRRRVQVCHQAAFSTFGFANTDQYRRTSGHSAEYMRALHKERKAMSRFIESGGYLRLILWPVRVYSLEHRQLRFRALLRWIESVRGNPRVRVRCGPYDGGNTVIVPGKLVVTAHKTTLDPGYDQTLVSYQRNVIRAAVDEFQATWATLETRSEDAASRIREIRQSQTAGV